jgi:hypothetical protein
MKWLRFFSARPLVLTGLALAALAVVLCAPLAPAAAAYVTANWMQPSLWHIGGTLEVATGAKVTIAGVDKTTALGAAVTNPVTGGISGYKISTGEVALTGTNPVAVATGLTSIASCVLTLKSTTAPTTAVLSYGSSGGTLNVYGWMPTNATTTTLIASTGTGTVGWSCRGA